MKNSCMLLVEDNPIHRHTISSRLAPVVCCIDKVSTVAAAIQRVCKKKYDLILLDRQLPDGDGCEIARFIRSSEHLASYHAYIIAQTSYLNARDTNLCKESGINIVLSKPLNYALMEKIVANLGSLHTEHEEPVVEAVRHNNRSEVLSS